MDSAMRDHSPARLLELMPKLMGLVFVAPLTLGLGYLTWDVTRESLDVQRNWRLAEATVLEGGDSSAVRLALTMDGGRHEAEFPRAGDLKPLQAGEVRRVYINPRNPEEIRLGDGGSLWAGTGVLGFFTLAMGGVLVFLLRVKPLKMPEFEPFEDDPEDAEPEPAERFRPPMSAPLLELRPSPRVWRASLFWGAAGVLGFLAAAGVPWQEGLWIRALAAAGSGAWVYFMVRRGLASRSLALRGERDRLVVIERGIQREIPFRQIRDVVRTGGEPGAFILLDEQGGRLLRLEGDLEPPEALTALLRRIHEWRNRRR
jgi:hypothetical protein